ncbi:metallophosphoesterase family protein [Patulibacter americanus]|uniref:metallophosphoesterase family protein n=1 Tax=Patulibacter americanus TaxID=588672 RepID=UPI0003B4DB50|nr:Ig-like domain repeat protein [Patulibacter americanus]
MRTATTRFPRRLSSVAALSCLALGAGTTVVAHQAAAPTAAHAQAPAGDPTLLTDPFLQLPTADGVTVAWMTEFRGADHVVLVGDGVGGLSAGAAADAARTGRAPGVRVVPASSRRLSRVGEDSASFLPADRKPAVGAGIVDREVWRHEAVVDGLTPGRKTPYRVVSGRDGSYVSSGAFRLAPAPPKGAGQRILLTSDHQAMVNTPANLEMAAKTIGDIDAVFMAGDLANIPDRASEWFDDTRGSAFFPVLQGRGGRVSTHGETYKGAEIIQNAPIFPAVGNHEVQGRRAGATTLGGSFNAPVPRAIVERAYAAAADTVNPGRDPQIKEDWIRENSFSTSTYEELFTLPSDSPGGETYYAITIGDVRLISLYSTRIWRSSTANPAPADRASSTRYQESRTSLTDPLAQGYGEHIFEPVDAESEQLKWLEKELQSPEFKNARFRVAMLHEGPQGLGDNIMPVFTDPVRTEERDATGALEGVRYEYPSSENHLVNDLQPMLEQAGVDLVQNGHSHLWNRFQGAGGTHFLETSNTGNTYGAFHHLSGRSRPLPPAPWLASNYMSIGNPGGLAPILPTDSPMLAPNGVPMPFVQSNDHNVFTVLDTAKNEVVSYIYDVRTPTVRPKVLDRFSLGRPAGPDGTGTPAADGTPSPADGTATPAADAPQPPAVGGAATGAAAPGAPAPGGPGTKPSRTFAAAGSARYGTAATVRVRVAGAASGVVAVSKGREPLATGRVRDGVARVVVPGTALRPGRHRLTVRFAGDAGVAGSATTSTVVVRSTTPKVTAAVAPGRIVAGRTRSRVSVRVTAPGLRPAGRIVVRVGDRVLGRATVRGGRATLRLSRFGSAGRHALAVTYRGDTGIRARTVTVPLKVARR